MACSFFLLQAKCDVNNPEGVRVVSLSAFNLFLSCNNIRVDLNQLVTEVWSWPLWTHSFPIHIPQRLTLAGFWENEGVFMAMTGNKLRRWRERMDRRLLKISKLISEQWICTLYGSINPMTAEINQCKKKYIYDVFTIIPHSLYSSYIRT